MRRRSLLAASGLALLGPGCLRDTGPSLDPAAGPATEESPGSPSFSVTEAGVFPGYVTAGDDSIGTVDGAGQYLLVGTASTSERPSADEFAFSVDGETYTHEPSDARLYWPEELAATESFGKWLIFPLPETADATDARLSWPGGEWTPPERVRERLTEPLPDFEVTFDAPERVGPDESPTLSLSVHNPADVDGNTVLALNRVGPQIAYAPVREIVLECPPGETVDREFGAHSPHEPTDPREVTYHLHVAGGGRTSRTIEPAE
ncbi:hypothetical protein [Haloparvum sedimenti]|uniref:hypothetical protein n=1 Tax=Haloparvum sedimenti TaxID=1678448 RepID=UPI00071E9B45|nr:hypothetical protein [Haloparvum sedimenti]